MRAQAGRRAPSEDSFRRLLAKVDAAAVDTAIGIFLAGRASRGNGEEGQEAAAAVAVDGKRWVARSRLTAAVCIYWRQ